MARHPHGTDPTPSGSLGCIGPSQRES